MQQAQATIAAKQKNKTQNKAMLILIILFGVDFGTSGGGGSSSGLITAAMTETQVV